jgi:hypothetical protein
MVWRPDINGSSINLIANIFGEGIAFGFALLANLLAVESDPRRRRWTWLCAMLAVGAKTIALLAVVAPCASLCWRAWRRRSRRELCPDGLALALAIALAWNGYLLLILGRYQYLGDWDGLLFWMRQGGGYGADASLFTFTRKFSQLEASHVSPWIVLVLTLLPALLIDWLRRTGQLHSDRLLRREQSRMVLASVGIYYAWYLLLAGRGWMRHLWIGYALLGWLAAVFIAQLLDQKKSLWPLGAATTLFLLATSIVHGTLPALGPLGPTEVWATQKELADQLAEKYPRSRLMVADWHMVPHIAYFMGRPQYDLYEVQPLPGDLFLCDRESGCDQILWKYCSPQITEARVAWCQYLPGPRK